MACSLLVFALPRASFYHAGLEHGRTIPLAEWAVQGLVTPHIGRSIDSSIQAINAGLESLKSGAGTLGKMAVTVDPEVGLDIASRRSIGSSSIFWKDGSRLCHIAPNFGTP